MVVILLWVSDGGYDGGEIYFNGIILGSDFLVHVMVIVYHYLVDIFSGDVTISISLVFNGILHILAYDTGELLALI